MTTSRRLARLSMIVATLAAAFTAQTAGAADNVVRLDTVVVTGHRAAAERVRVVQLPTVVVTGQRSPSEVALSAAPRNARGAVAGKSAV